MTVRCAFRLSSLLAGAMTTKLVIVKMLRFFCLLHIEIGRDQQKAPVRGRARHFESTGAGAGPESDFFLLPGPGRDLIFIYCRGRTGIKKILLPGPGLRRDQKF